MGLNCHIFSLPPIDKNLHILQNIRSLSYLRTFFELKSGKIKLLLEGLEIIKISEVFWDQTWFDEAEDIPDAEDIYASEPEDEYEDESS
ncbi:hypothetical protein HPULCUR_010735 [Helicostylum pulchrum]|uniref:Uncharacterized protein n=1 Tax=Helicostylum pulchrum TaxID=562976 RepID=A0ABP9YE79_9FUNG